MKMDVGRIPHDKFAITFSVEMTDAELAQLPRGIPSVFMEGKFPLARRLKALAEAAALLEAKSL